MIADNLSTCSERLQHQPVNRFFHIYRNAGHRGADKEFRTRSERLASSFDVRRSLFLSDLNSKYAKR